MKHIRARDFLPYLQQIEFLFRRIDQVGARDYIMTTLTYTLKTGNILDKEAYFAFIQKTLTKQTGDKLMTLAEILTEEGRQEGLQKGMQKGIQKTSRYIAYKLINRGYNYTEISEITGLTVKEIMALKNIEIEKVE